MAKKAAEKAWGKVKKTVKKTVVPSELEKLSVKTAQKPVQVTSVSSIIPANFKVGGGDPLVSMGPVSSVMKTVPVEQVQMAVDNRKKEKAADIFNNTFSILKQYATQGPEQLNTVAGALTGDALTNPGKNGLNYWTDAAGVQTAIDKQRMARNMASFFNSEKYALNPQTAFLPELDYLKQLQAQKQMDWANSLIQDDFIKANKKQNADQEVSWQNLYKAVQEQKDFSDEWYNLLLADHLMNNPGQMWDYEAADARYGEDVMDDTTYDAELKRLREQMKSVDWAAKTGYNTANYESQTALLKDQLGLLDKTIADKSATSKLEALARSNPNYAELAKYTGPVLKLGENEDFMFSDPWFYINNAGAKDFSAATHRSQLNWTNRQVEHQVSPYYDRGYEYMLPEDKEVYNVLRAMDMENGTDYSKQYLAAKETELLQSRADTNAEFWRTLASEDGTGWLAYLMARGQGYMNFGDKILQTIAAATGTNDPNAAYYDEENMKRAVDSEIHGNIGDIEWLNKFMIGDQNIGQHAFNAFTGLVDSTIPLAIDALFGGSGTINKALMAGQAYSSALQEAGERDLSPLQTILSGAGDAAWGALVESIGVDPSVLTGKNNFITNFFSEGAEGFLDNLGSDVKDGVLSKLFGSTSNYEDEVSALRLAGVENPEDTAFLNRFGEYAQSFIYEGLGGGLMGVPGNIADYTGTRAVGKAVTKDGDIDTIVNIAQSMPENSESKRISDEITAKQGKGKKPSFYQFGKLTKALVKDLGAEHADIINRVQDEAIVERLVELGEDRSAAKQNASIIRRIARGEKVPRKETFEAKWSDNATQVVKELTRETKPEDVNRAGNKWVADMEAQQLSETSEVIGKQIQVQVATVTPIGKAANRAEEAAKKRVPKRDGKPKLATDSHVTFRAADGNAEISGDILRFEESEEGMDVVVQTGKGKEGEQKVKLEDWISADGDGVATILSYIGDEQLPHSVTAEEANTLMQVYKHSGGNAKAVIQAFDVNYLAGYSGNNQVGSVLDPALSKIAYENGKRDAEKDEAQRKQRASEYKAMENPVAGWIGKVDGREQVKGLGDAKALEEAMQAMPESQRTAAEIMIETGKAVGLNVVLYDSDGKGAANDIQNGMFEGATHTVYFDVSAWAGNAKRVQALKKEGTLGYAMLRVGGHELTHYLEVAAPEAYAKYSKTVKDALKAKGVDFAVQMRERIDKANAQGRKLTMAGAAAEVIADASENMLQDSKLFNSLDTDTKGKIRAFLQNFAQKVKEIFQHLTGGHKESAALREMKNGVYHYLEGLQDLWDAGFDEILAKGTTDQSGDATEMVEGLGAKYSLREYDQHQIDNWANSKTIEVYRGDTQQVLDFVERSIANKTLRKKLYFGKVSPELAAAIYEATGVRTENMNLALHSDEVLKILADHGTKETEEPRGQRAVVAEDFAEIIEVVTSPDTITRSETDRFGKPVIEFAKEKNGKRTVVTYTSEKHNDLRVQTVFIGAKKRSLATPMDEHASINTPEASSGTASNNSVPQSAEKVNPDVKNSDRDTADKTETDAFKRWFGDSVVVNEDGTPKVMYHGTTRGGFTVFDGGKDYYYFTDNRKYAYTFAGRKANGQYYPITKKAEAEGRRKSQIYKVYLSVQNPYITDDVDIIEDALYWDKTLAQKLRDKGYDALMLPDMSQVIVLNPSQIKSATDNVGTFDPENTDIRYSDRDLPDGVTIREYLGAMKPTSSMTETEKLLLKRYQDQLRTLEEKEKLVEEQEEIIRTAPFRNPDGSLNDEITKAKNRYKIYRDQANRAARALANAEKDEGFARLMATSRQVVNDYLLGAAGNVADAQDVLESEINELTRQLTKLEADVTRTSQGQRTAFARGLYNPDDLKAAAQKLKDTYGSRMSVQNIANRLALAYGELYANDGAEGARLFSAAAKDLATDLLAGNKFRYQSEILPMLREQIGTISLSNTDLQEIENRGYTLREYKSMLSPYIKVTAEGSDLSSYASNAEYYGDGALAAVLGDTTEGNLAMRLYDVISQELAKEADNGYDGMSESQLIGMAMADIAGVNLPMSANSSTVEYLRKELLKYAGENADVAITVEEAISKAKKATDKAGRIWLEAAKNTETARQAVEYYRALDEKRRVMELAEQKKQITEQLKSETAKKLEEKVAKQREEYREREKKAREYRKTRDEVDKLRRRISRNVKRLNTLRVRETDQKHVPQELQHVADAVMSTFTDSELGRLVFHEAKLMNLGRTYRLLRQSETDAAYFWDDEIETDIDNLQALGEAYGALRNREGNAPSRFSLEGVELETEILQGVDAIVSHVLNMIDSTNTGFLYQRNETFTQFANKAGEKLRNHKDYKNLKGALGRIQHMLDESLRTGNTTPVYFFEHLENQEIMDVFDEVRKGMRRAAIIEREGKKVIEKARAKYNYGSWVADGKLTMKTGQGHTIELTREEAAEIYAIAKREAANKLYQTEHLLYGGFNYKHIDEKGKGLVRVKDQSHQLDKADIAKISSWLTEEQKAYADELVGYLSTDMADYGNDASMKMYGYKKFTESYYIPFHTVANQRFQKGDEGPQGENAGTGRVRNSGFTHKVQYKANQALYVGGISETVADHIHKMAAYAAMVEPIENMKRLLNHKMLETDGTSNTIRALIGQKYGQASEDYMTQLLKDLNGATMGDKRAAGLTDKMIGAFKRGAVMASASVVLQQPTAMTRAMAMISPKYFANNPFYRPGKGTWEEMMGHSGTAVIKDMGKFDVGMGLTATQYILDEDLNMVEAYQRLKAESKTKAGKAAYDRFMAWLTAAPGVADQWTWGMIWKAVKAEQADLHPDMDQTSDAFLDMVGERFDDVIDHTQVYDSVLSRSNLMRSTSDLHKMATSFMSEPTLSLNMLYDALSGWKSKRHTGGHRGRIIGSVVASQVLAGAMAALVQAWNDDDDKRTAMEKYADRATGNILDNLNPLGMIPYISDIVSLFEGYDVERPDMSVIADIYSYGKTFFKSFEDGGAPTWKEIENFAGTIANLTGVPAKNISREIRRTRNAVFNTEWSAPTGINLGQAMLENMPYYSDKNNEYYQRIVTAKVRGDDELAEDLRTYMLTSKMVKEEAMTEGIREAYQARYEKGGIEKEDAIAFLLENNLATGATEDKRKQSAFQYVDKWEEGTTDYSAYNTLRAAFAAINYTDIKSAWKELTDNGFSNDQVGKYVRETILVQLVQDGTINTYQATELLRKWYPYKKDKDNVEKPKEWLKNKK